MSHIVCSARDPQDTLGTVCIPRIYRWDLTSQSFQPMNMGIDLLPQIPSSIVKRDFGWFSEVKNENICKKIVYFSRVRLLATVREIRPHSFPEVPSSDNRRLDPRKRRKSSLSVRNVRGGGEGRCVTRPNNGCEGDYNREENKTTSGTLKHDKSNIDHQKSFVSALN